MNWFANAVLVFLLLAAGSSRATADEAKAWAALRQGGHVALIRHADAPGAPGDPAGFKLDDCATQRNLSAQGKAEAAALGQKLKAAGVVAGRVLSSPWCRCIDTAKLMDLGAATIEPSIANAYTLSAQRQSLTDGARKIVDAWTGPGTLIVVTHGANILALSGISPQSGEIVVVAPSAGRDLQVIGRIPVQKL